MRVGRIVVLWTIAVVLGVLHYAEERRPEPVPAEVARAVGPLLDVGEDEVLAIRLVDGARVLRLGRAGAGWRVLEPADAGVPGDLVRAFVEAFFSAVVLEAVPAKRDGEAGFGFDEGRRIEVEVEEGSRRVFVLGDVTPTGTSAYVRDGNGAVRVIGRNALVYRNLLLDAVRPPAKAEPPTGPVAVGPLTGAGGPG